VEGGQDEEAIDQLVTETEEDDQVEATKEQAEATKEDDQVVDAVEEEEDERCQNLILQPS